MVYALFGTSLLIGPQIRAQIRELVKRIPPEFLGRDMDDLGCGDGKITVILRDIFKPRKLRGFDVYPSLVKRAGSRGIRSEVMDLDAELPRGELAVMWGVLHHLKDTESCIRRISQNYRRAFIREPIRNSSIKGLEMGEPLIKEDIEKLVLRYLQGAHTFYYGHCIFIFYVSPGASPVTGSPSTQSP